jgi:hypothetical protein
MIARLSANVISEAVTLPLRESVREANNRQFA